MNTLAGRVVLVTGGASGIGAATAAELLRCGALPVLVDHDEGTLAGTAQTLGGGLLTVVADVTRSAECEAAVARTLEHHGRLDVLWANAGIAAFGPLQHTDAGAWQRCLDVNVMGVFHTLRAGLPALLQSRGYALITASLASFAHPPLMSAYAASKAAVEAAANAWRLELAPHGVAVGVIHASWVQTPLVAEGAMHPAFTRLRRTMPALLSGVTPADSAARIIVRGIAHRQRRIWVPGWVRLLYAMRSLLHLAVAERAWQAAAPELEALYLQGLQEHGRLASSLGPREHAQALRRGQSD